MPIVVIAAAVVGVAIGIVNNGLVNPCENNIQQAALNCSKYIRR